MSRIVRHASHDIHYCPPAPHQLISIIITIITLHLQLSLLPSHHALAALLPETPTSIPDTPAVMLDSQQDTTSPAAWQRHCETKKPSATPVSSHVKQKPFRHPIFRSHTHSLSVSIVVAWHLRDTQPAQSSLPHPEKILILILIIPVPNKRSALVSAGLSFDFLVCAK